jgi:hypothetical protein
VDARIASPHPHRWIEVKATASDRNPETVKGLGAARHAWSRLGEHRQSSRRQPRRGPVQHDHPPRLIRTTNGGELGPHHHIRIAVSVDVTGHDPGAEPGVIAAWPQRLRSDPLPNPSP